MSTRELGDVPCDLPPLEVYRLIRGAIEHEDNLMSQRLNWFVASQSFLFTALAITQKDPGARLAHAMNFLYPLIPSLALVSCVLLSLSIFAGIAVLFQLRRELLKLYARQRELQPSQPTRIPLLLGLLTPSRCR